MFQRSEANRSHADVYLGTVRSIPVEIVRSREDIRDTPVRCTPDEWKRGGADLERLVRMMSFPGVAIPVRSPIDGALVDIRIRRLEPVADQPKIVGMLGGVTSDGAVDGKGRELLGCYGFPHEITSDVVVVVEGLVDYLTALAAWPKANVLGAVEAGTLSLVAKHAATELARRGDDGRLILVEHADGVDKAADRAMNSDVNAATKVGVRILGPRRVGWMICEGVAKNGETLKDLNDLWRTHTPINPVWWTDIGDGEAA